MRGGAPATARAYPDLAGAKGSTNDPSSSRLRARCPFLERREELHFIRMTAPGPAGGGARASPSQIPTSMVP